jgi:hypothetical protein
VKLTSFPEQNGVLAKSQPQYIPMPVHFTNDQDGRMICCWRLTFFERIRILFSGKVWHQVLTFHQPLQPQLLTISKPRDMIWNPKAAVQPVPVPPTLTPAPFERGPAASTSSDADVPSPTISEPPAQSNSSESESST